MTEANPKRKKHSRGKKTFFYLYIIHGWVMYLIAAIFAFLAWAIYFGPLNTFATSFLAEHSDWYLAVSNLAEWFVLVAVAFFIFAYLLAYERYIKYKFILDQHAFHVHYGIFFIHETTILYHQISNVYIFRPYHYRLFGIAQLDIITAASKSLENNNENLNRKFLIPVIDTSLARALSKKLLENASRSKGNQNDKDDAYEDGEGESDEEETEDSE